MITCLRLYDSLRIIIKLSKEGTRVKTPKNLQKSKNARTRNAKKGLTLATSSPSHNPAGPVGRSLTLCALPVRLLLDQASELFQFVGSPKRVFKL